MKKLIVFIILFNSIYAEYLVVDNSSIESGQDGDIVVYNIQDSFSQLLNISSNNLTKEIPIYIKSDSCKIIQMRMSNITDLRNQEGDKIETSLSFKGVNSNAIPILDGINFTLLDGEIEKRDGKTIIGNIIVKIDTVANIQTLGEYQLTSDIIVQLGDNSSSSSGIFSINGSVPLVAVASFESIDNYEDGKKFISATVNFGSLNENNSIKRELYIKNTSLNSFKLRFNTSDLKHTIYPRYTIGMNYYYTPSNGSQITIGNGTDFIAFIGKNDGSSSVGNIEFKTDKIVFSSLIVGDYKTTLNVVITIE